MADIRLEELVALNDEIASLTRSGVPLEIGLTGFGQSVRGRLGRLAVQLGQQTSQGKPLEQALAESPASFPPVYRAIVTAGLRAGRLPAALEAVAVSARNMQEMRRSIGLALIYPLVLIVATYFAFWLLLAQVTPVMMRVYEGSPPPFLAALAHMGQLTHRAVPVPLTDQAIIAGWIPPLAFATAVAIWWFASGGVLLGGGALGRVAGWLPWVGRVARNARLAALCEIMALLVENDVPLAEALRLAAGSAGDRRLARAARDVSARLEQGGASPDEVQLASLGPLLAWLVSAGGRQQTFVRLARHTSDVYRRRVSHQTRWLREVLPMWLVIVVGGGLVALLAVTTYLPFVQLMQALGETLSDSIKVKP